MRTLARIFIVLRSVFFILLGLSVVLLSCSKDRPAPVAPAGKSLAALAAPAAPTNLRFDTPTDSSCTVRWDASDGATDYDVNYKPAVGGRWTNEPHRGIGLSNTIHDLQPNTEYRWAVRAENSDGTSEWIHGSNFTTRSSEDDSLNEVSASPTNLRFDAPTATSCTVRWDASDGATDYDVNYKPAVGGRWTNEPHRGTELYNTINDLEPDTEYRWAVRAENRDGPSGWVFGENFTTLDEPETEANETEADAPPQTEPNPLPPIRIPDPNRTIWESIPDSLDGFYIQLVFDPNDDWEWKHREAMLKAKLHWEDALYNLPHYSPGRYFLWKQSCFSSYYPASTVSVDDLRIFVEQREFENSPTQAMASPSLERESGLTATGCIRIERIDDLEHLEMVFAHEIGHVLGFGTQFVIPPPVGYLEQLVEMDDKGAASFIGYHTKRIYAEGGGSGAVPLEDWAGHWQYPLLRNTLMSPHGNSPLAITTLDLAAMADMGYRVNMGGAIPFQLPSGKATIDDRPTFCSVCALGRVR